MAIWFVCPGWVFRRASIVGLGLSVLISGCAVGPDYQRPLVEVGDEYLHQPTTADGWKAASPNYQLGAQDWWQVFKDPTLNTLMQQLRAHNASLEQSEARYRQAIATLEASRAAFFPTLGVEGSVSRSGGGSTNTSSTYSTSLRAGWEPDIWGKVRRGTEASQAEAQATEADFFAARLSLEAALAQNYFQLKNILASQTLMDQTIDAYERVYTIVQNRFEVGMVSPRDVASAKVQLENARTQRLALNRQQGQLHNALAVLTGQPPIRLAPMTLTDWPHLPVVPLSLPSQLLERRPDVAAAERRMQAANAQIGVATAAWFPDLTLSAQGGYRAGAWADWLTAPARFWSLGPALALSILDGGARSARVREAEARYDAQVSSYRQQVLDALKEVEDSLVQWQGLQEEMLTQQAALEAARESQRLMRNQFEAGTEDFLDLAQVETAALSAERATISLLSEQYIAAVQLITALGGNWTGLPSEPSGVMLHPAQ